MKYKLREKGERDRKERKTKGTDMLTAKGRKRKKECETAITDKASIPKKCHGQATTKTNS